MFRVIVLLTLSEIVPTGTLRINSEESDVISKSQLL